MWTLKPGRWGSHSVPPVLRLGLPLCPMPTVQGGPLHTRHDHGHLHTPQESLAPQARVGPQSSPKSGPNWRCGRGLGLGPVWGLHSKAFFF